MSNGENTEYGWNSEMSVSLLDKLKIDLKTAMKNKNLNVRDAIRLIMGDFPKLTMPIKLESGKKTTRVKTHEEITDEDLLNIIRGFVKSEKTVLEIKKEESSEYLNILESYLPKMANRQDVQLWIKGNIDFSQYKSPMQAMGPIMKHFGKLADGNMVKQILQDISS